MDREFEQPQELRVRFPFFSAGFRGNSVQVLVVILFLVVAVGLAAMLSQHEANARDRLGNQAKANSEIKQAIENNTKATWKQTEAIRDLIWVTTLPEKEKAKLHLVKPKGIREMERIRDD